MKNLAVMVLFVFACVCFASCGYDGGLRSAGPKPKDGVDCGGGFWCAAQYPVCCVGSNVCGATQADCPPADDDAGTPTDGGYVPPDGGGNDAGGGGDGGGTPDAGGEDPFGDVKEAYGKCVFDNTCNNDDANGDTVDARCGGVCVNLPLGFGFAVTVQTSEVDGLVATLNILGRENDPNLPTVTLKKGMVIVPETMVPGMVTAVLLPREVPKGSVVGHSEWSGKNNGFFRQLNFEPVWLRAGGYGFAWDAAGAE